MGPLARFTLWMSSLNSPLPRDPLPALLSKACPHSNSSKAREVGSEVGTRLHRVSTDTEDSNTEVKVVANSRVTTSKVGAHP